MVVLRAYRIRVDPDRLADYERMERLDGVPMVASQEGCLACGFGRVREAQQPGCFPKALRPSKRRVPLSRTWVRLRR